MKIKNISLFVLILSILLSSVCVFADAEELKDGIFSYTVSGNSVTITGCDDIEGKVTIPDKIDNKPVTAISDGAFGGSSNISQIDIPNSVVSIGSMCFAYSPGIVRVKLPDNLTKIEEGLFFQCVNLIGITIPNSVSAISDNAFSSCKSLGAITISESVTSISETAFEGCPYIRFYCRIADGLYPYEFAKARGIGTEELIYVYVNDKLVDFDQPPITDNKRFRTLVPLRSVLEYMGADIEWDEMMEYAAINIDGYRILIKPGYDFMMVNGKTTPLTCPATEYNGRILLPIRDVVQAVGGKVKWDENSKIVSISYKQ